MVELSKEYKGFRMSIESKGDLFEVFAYQDDKLLAVTEVDQQDMNRVLQVMLTPLVESEKYEESAVVRDLIKELC